MNTTVNFLKTKNMILCGVFAAIMCVVGGMSIVLPFTPVPITLGSMAVMLTGAVLGSKYGTISTAVYLLLGAVGVPVFAGYEGGFAKFAGPTGGYLVGFLLTAFVTGLIIEKMNTNNKLWIEMVAMTVGVFFCYVLGTAWFMITTGSGLAAALISCVIPFLPGAVLKIVAASLLSTKLRPMLEKMQ